MSAQTISVKVILGTTREGRFGDKPAHWILGEAARLPGVEAELLDLRDYPLPFFDRPVSPARGAGVYEAPAVQRWADQIARADAFIVVSPEYNHGYSAVLKNALDHLYPEWARKAIGFVGYGNVGGARAIEQLRLVAVELQMWPIKAALHLPLEVYLAAMKEPVPPNPQVFEPLRKGFGDRVAMFFDDLQWAARALKAARAAQP
ncbi:MAG TPA: NAD(P)H-dependent oxidoreductase [Polyangia bacterium]